MAREVFGGRALLNLPGYHSTAAIVAEITDTSNRVVTVGSDNDGYRMQPQITCKITDCDSAVNIEFGVDTANQLENSLHKLDTMIEVLSAMREGLIIEHHRLQDRLDTHPHPQSLYLLRDAVGKRSTIRPSCPCGRPASGTTPGGTPECDDPGCNAAVESER